MSLKKEILTRIAVVYVLFVLLGLGIVAKIIYIQFFEGQRWRAKAKVITYKDVTVPPNRGDICATDGRVLATSVPYFELRMDLLAGGVTDSVFRANIDSLSICLSSFFRDRSRYAYKSELTNARRLAKNRRFYPVAPRKVNYIELQQIRQFPLFRLGENKGGFIPVQSNRRILPHATMAARTIGTVNEGGVSVGLEGAFDYALRGKAGLRVHQRIPGNSWVEVKSAGQIDSEDGADVISTIDVELQDVAEAALRRQLDAHRAEHGCAILMEVATGDIKAIANLKRENDGSYSEVYNYAIGESVEPGSTMKTPTLVALLEDGLVELTDSVNTGTGRYRIYDRTIVDSKENGHGKIPVKEVFEVSSNIGVVKLVNQHYKGREKDFIDRLYAMKLHRPLNIAISGEAAPYIKYPGDKLWSGMSLPMMSIGYELRLTPLQILTFYNAIANNGRMVKPRLVKSLVRHGQVVQRFSPEVISSSICSKATLRKVREMLEGVVEHGTAMNLKNPRYKIAGKTGTAQVARGSKGYRFGGRVSYSASFAGYFPADNPKYSCIVVVNSPSNSVYYGNLVAGPIFKEISDKVYATSPEWFRRVDSSGKLKELPQAKSSHRDALATVLGKLKIPFESVDEKSDWIATKRNGARVEMRELAVAKQTVPNVVGMGLKDALFLLENNGLRVSFKGRGTVRSQSVQAGSRVVPGSTVFLEMSLG